MKISPRPMPPRRPRRSHSLRMLITITITTTMVATGGFGVFPDNPLTQTFQQVISENVSPEFLNPFNSYLENISAPTIAVMPKTNNNHPPDIFDFISGNEIHTVTSVPFTSTVATPIPSETSTVIPTETPTGTATLTLTPTPSPTLTLTPTSTTTPTYLPTWTRTPRPTSEDDVRPRSTPQCPPICG